MSEVFNVYCDESCHLEHDSHQAMVLGAVWCPRARVRSVTGQIKRLKSRYGIPTAFEIKWTKVSPGKREFYAELVNFFFEQPDLHFRALVVPDKRRLNHAAHTQTHDDWYYKMYFDLLKVIIDPKSRYRIYLDIKDTRGGNKVQRLHEVLSNEKYDFARQIVESIQVVRSGEVQLLQVTDLLIGVVSYANRRLHANAAKAELVQLMRDRSRYTLLRSTLLREDKVNLFHWQASEVTQ